MTPFELQQTMERYTAHFIDGVTDALHEPLQSQHSPVHRAALQRLLSYCSSALDIATGPIPEINVLDMAVFLALSRSAIESHWIPNILGADGRALLDVFVRAEAEFDEILDLVLRTPQQVELAELIRSWLTSNPGRVSVEWVRFQDFAGRALRCAAHEQGNHAVHDECGAGDREQNLCSLGPFRTAKVSGSSRFLHRSAEAGTFRRSRLVE